MQAEVAINPRQELERLIEERHRILRQQATYNVTAYQALAWNEEALRRVMRELERPT